MSVRIHSYSTALSVIKIQIGYDLLMCEVFPSVRLLLCILVVFYSYRYPTIYTTEII